MKESGHAIFKQSYKQVKHKNEYSKRNMSFKTPKFHSRVSYETADLWIQILSISCHNLEENPICKYSSVEKHYNIIYRISREKGVRQWHNIHLKSKVYTDSELGIIIRKLRMQYKNGNSTFLWKFSNMLFFFYFLNL